MEYRLEDITSRMADKVDTWEKVMYLYGGALKKVTLQVELLNDEFQYLHNYNPIEHTKSRLKEAESIVKKLKRHGHESTIVNMVRYLKDIAGVRIVCSFTEDIYKIADMLQEAEELKVLEIRDYIEHPKASGYRSYHMIVAVPVNMDGDIIDTVVEIQIRTVAMDFWATLEHKIQYKFDGNAPVYIGNELRDCAKMVTELDNRMLSLNRAIQEAAHQQGLD